MPRKFIHNIIVFGLEARVITQNSTGALAPGDSVTFLSDGDGDISEIRYKIFSGAVPPNTQAGSPFEPALLAGTRQPVGTGITFTVTKACTDANHFTFECGRDVGNVFKPWANHPHHPAMGNTPGPDD